MLDVLFTTKKVVEKAESVSIDMDNAIIFAESMREHVASVKPGTWVDSGLTFQEAVFFLLIFNSINYCFWAEHGKKKWAIEDDGKLIGGSRGLFICLEKEAKSNANFFDPMYWLRLERDEMGRILSSEIPMLAERAWCVKSVGKALTAKYDGIEGFISEHHASATSYVEGLVANFDCYHDSRKYHGVGTVQFLKRAQLFASMLNDVVVARGYGELENVDRLTAFADYRIPQTLRHYGVLNYSKALGQAIEEHKLVPEHCQEEIEIRACTVWAVEELKLCLMRTGCPVTSAAIDSVLWNTSQQIKNHALPCHMTYTTAY